MPSRTLDKHPMENSLHAQKVAILSRLVKESSLTLEEALLLLKEEDVQESEQTPVQPAWNPGTTSPAHIPYWGGSGYPLTGTVTVPNGITINTTGVPTTTAPFTFNSTPPADLNN